MVDGRPRTRRRSAEVPVDGPEVSLTVDGRRVGRRRPGPVGGRGGPRPPGVDADRRRRRPRRPHDRRGAPGAGVVRKWAEVSGRGRLTHVELDRWTGVAPVSGPESTGEPVAYNAGPVGLGQPVFGPGFFAGIEHPVAENLAGPAAGRHVRPARGRRPRPRAVPHAGDGGRRRGPGGVLGLRRHPPARAAPARHPHQQLVPPGRHRPHGRGRGAGRARRLRRRERAPRAGGRLRGARRRLGGRVGARDGPVGPDGAVEVPRGPGPVGRPHRAVAERPGRVRPAPPRPAGLGRRARLRDRPRGPAPVRRRHPLPGPPGRRAHPAGPKRAWVTGSSTACPSPAPSPATAIRSAPEPARPRSTPSAASSTVSGRSGPTRSSPSPSGRTRHRGGCPRVDFVWRGGLDDTEAEHPGSRLDRFDTYIDACLQVYRPAAMPGVGPGRLQHRRVGGRLLPRRR